MLELSGRRYVCTLTDESSRLRAKRVALCQISVCTRTTVHKDRETDCKATCRYVQVICAVQPWL